MGKILSSPAIKEGDLLSLILLGDSIREHCSDKIAEIIHKICPMINSDRFTYQKRLYALFLSGKVMVGN